MKIAVYCSAKDRIPSEYLALGDTLGKWIAESGYTLVYGGATGGLMTRVSNAAKAAGARGEGVIPQRIIQAKRMADNCDEMHVVDNMSQRKQKMREIILKEKEASAVEQDMLTTLEVCYEFYLRGFHFDTISIYESEATEFKITKNGLLPPFVSVHGLGEAAALDTVEKRKGKNFISVEEFSMCCNKLSKTHIEQLKALGAFAGMAETSQMTLF